MPDRRRCPRCGRLVAFRPAYGAKVRAGKSIPALMLPVPHNRLDPVTGEPGRVRCDYGQKRGRRP